ncbi:hypothetical protein DPMN_001394 [Dreissena polymorpha]|uniref:Uncharacterized protein n=1 Tax=Dreissena polymorpha TaxID=45954 RepID=A0A9D4MJR6_DREPO|nr:hypothetical protein DPMN_001394 [Dreissena polymorpha]
MNHIRMVFTDIQFMSPNYSANSTSGESRGTRQQIVFQQTMVVFFYAKFYEEAPRMGYAY